LQVIILLINVKTVAIVVKIGVHLFFWIKTAVLSYKLANIVLALTHLNAHTTVHANIMNTFTLNINGATRQVTVDPTTPILWVLRDHLDLQGTKFGCGVAACGACTIHLDGQPVRSCQLPVSAVEGAAITTIEGLSSNGDHPVQKAWLEHDVAQCGYCQAGQMMSAAALLKNNPNPSEEDIAAYMAGNICRCGTYPRIKAAILTAAKK
jgi:isoquinoline 1-oxidoreductase subunit alpha